MPIQTSSFDAIVVGIGGMGSASLFHLARRGVRVLGIEQFDIPHAMGSSHGITRIIRKAYFEHPSYVPLLMRSYELWNELEEGAGEKLLHVTGSVDVGMPGSRVFDGSLESCQVHRLKHEVLDDKTINERFPGYAVPAGFRAVYQPEGGFLLSEQCIVAYCFQALRHGAILRGREKVLSWQPRGGVFEVQTDRGRYSAPKIAITAGPWIGKLMPTLGNQAIAERQVLGWFQPPAPELFTHDRFPVFNMTVDEGHFYGFPVWGVPGFKLGRYHHLNETADADSLEREIRRQDEVPLREFIDKYFPKASGPTLSLKTCMFTNTPDEHFIIDHDLNHEHLTVAAGFSGHGFKFASVVGEIVADLVVDGRTRHDISLFSASRLKPNA